MGDWKDRFLLKDANGSPDIDVVQLWSYNSATGEIERIVPRNLLPLYALLASPAFTGNPTAPTQSPGMNNTRLASTAYVDAAVAAMAEGRAWKQPVRVATTANGTLATAFDNGETVDGVVIATGDRILIKDQSSATENGIYVVAASGAPTRATDADAGSELVNASVFVSEGTANADKQFVCTTNGPITIGATNIAFTVTGAGGGTVDDTAYDATSWNGDTTNAPSKNAIRDEVEAIYAAIGGGASDTVYKLTNQDKTSDTTLADDSALVTGTLDANSVYAVEIQLFYVVNATGPGVKFRTHLTETPQESEFVVRHQATLGLLTATPTYTESLTGGGAADTTTLTASGQYYGTASYRGYLVTHASNTSVLSVQWAQNSSDGSNFTRMQRGSWIKAVKAS